MVRPRGKGRQGAQPAGLVQGASGLLTSLALHLQTDFDPFIYELHNSPEVILTKLSRGQGWCT